MPSKICVRSSLKSYPRRPAGSSSRLDAANVTSAQVDELKAQGFSDAEVFDIAATAAGRAFFAKLLDALGVEPDSPFLELEAALRVPLTVGRPIGQRPCVTVSVATP